MSDIFTPTQAEDAIAQANDFLWQERHASLDGGFASQQLESRVVSVAEQAEQALTARKIQGKEGFYAPLSKANAHEFGQLATVLPGYTVLIPGQLVGGEGFLPAVISEQDATASTMRLHVFKRPYTGQLLSSVGTVLSASGQSETAGVGEHNSGRVAADGIEAEHFAALLAVGNDKEVREAWQHNVHVNHQWRSSPTTSVTAEVSARLFGGEIPQSTITITDHDIRAGRAALLWHEGLRNASGNPESAARPDALVVWQALGFLATPPVNLDAMKEVIA